MSQSFTYFYYFNLWYFLLLFWNKAISSCTSETKTGCNNNSGTSITYLCIDGLKIYGFASGATGTCLQEFSLTDDALSVIGVVDNNSDPSNPTSTITKQSDTITSAEGKLTIFSCTSGECTQQFGYVFDASNQYSVGSEGDSAKLTFDSTTVCNTAGVGVIIKKSGTTDTIEFCLDGTNEKSVTVSSDNEGDYLMVGTKLGEGSTLPASRLTTTEGQDNTVITIGSNYIIYNEAYTTSKFFFFFSYSFVLFSKNNTFHNYLKSYSEINNIIFI